MDSTLGDRPTVNDIARVAGVSLATVDRVLNERPGVRDTTIARVQSAVESLGYVRDVTAANLARQRQYRIAFFLPDRRGQFLDALADTLEAVKPGAWLDRTNVMVNSYGARDPHALARQLEVLKSEDVDGVAIVSPETPQVRDAVDRLKREGIAVVAMVSDLPSTRRDRFVGVDNIAAGRTAGTLLGLFAGQARGSVLVVAGSTNARDSVERRLGFDQVLAASYPDLTPLPSIEGHDDPRIIERAVGNSLSANSDIVAVYSIATEHSALLRVLARHDVAQKLPVVAHELTPEARAALLDGSFDAVISQNPGHVVRSSLRVLRAKSDGREVDDAQESIRIEIVIRDNLHV